MGGAEVAVAVVGSEKVGEASGGGGRGGRRARRLFVGGEGVGGADTLQPHASEQAPYLVVSCGAVNRGAVHGHTVNGRSVSHGRVSRGLSDTPAAEISPALPGQSPVDTLTIDTTVHSSELHRPVEGTSAQGGRGWRDGQASPLRLGSAPSMKKLLETCDARAHEGGVGNREPNSSLFQGARTSSSYTRRLRPPSSPPPLPKPRYTPFDPQCHSHPYSITPPLSLPRASSPFSP